jgi:DNA-binding transcriptional ArsR family regulator
MLKSIDVSRLQDFERLRTLLEMIADRTRQDILLLFLEKAEWNAGQIAERFSLSRPTVSHHVNLLVRGGVLDCRKDGKERWYRFRRDDVVGLLRMAADLLGGCC